MRLKELRKNKMFGDAIYYYLGKIIPGLIGFLLPPLLIRILGVSYYGEYSLLQSSLLLTSTFVTGWLGQSFMRFYSSKENKKDYSNFFYQLIFWINIISTPFVFTVIILLGYNWALSILYSITYFSLNLFSLLTIENNTKLFSKKVVFADGIRAITFIITPIILYFLDFSKPDNYIFFIFLGGLISYSIASIYLQKQFFSNLRITFKINKIWLREMLKYGTPIAFWMVTAYLLNISDRFIIKYFLGFEEVGIYSAIYDIFYKLMTFAFMPLLMAFQPIIIKLFNEGQTQKVDSIIKKVIFFLITIFIILFILVYFLKSYIIIDFLNLSLQKSDSIILPIFVGAFIWNLSMFVHKPLELKKKTNIMLYGVMLAFTFNLIGNIIFIPTYGLIAAAYTTLLSTLVYLVYVIIYLKYKK